MKRPEEIFTYEHLHYLTDGKKFLDGIALELQRHFRERSPHSLVLVREDRRWNLFDTKAYSFVKAPSFERIALALVSAHQYGFDAKIWEYHPAVGGVLEWAKTSYPGPLSGLLVVPQNNQRNILLVSPSQGEEFVHPLLMPALGSVVTRQR